MKMGDLIKKKNENKSKPETYEYNRDQLYNS